MKRLFTPEKKKVLFFDMNQTLLDPAATFNESFIEVIREYTDRWSLQDNGMAEQILANYYSEYSSKARSKKRTSQSRLEIKQQCLAGALKPLPLPQHPSFIKSLLQQIEEKGQRSPKPYPGVSATLESLSAHYRLAIISNGRQEKHERNLVSMRLDRFIPLNHLFTSAHRDKRKPHSAIFLHALQEMNVTPKQAVMVGNSWNNDVLGAVRVGMDAIWLHRGHTEKSSLKKIGSRKVAVIRKLEQLQELL
ncbi:HAD family hydrolase [Paenibacillus sp. J2TS4]|uniref:HAD family hydrolase n=1 Tax=Paenibacillus sp. J2TS4 TaxID=2807194 RepID=UPI001B1A90F5|nr:HAD family hydrolase [Paenibacillus sp. J2TS4]GIP33733.1 hypothetical protein J2TS4_29430 [Paenibacillus sp. J2TS4]